MPKGIMNLGPCPGDETPVQVGADNYEVLARKECKRYKKQLIELFGEPPVGAALVVRSNPHDFGCYYEVAVSYDPDCREAVEYAFKIESNTPESWDD